ncbi:MAG: oxidoreductase [Bacteroidales bacterium]
MKTALIAGATGLIGSELIKLLIDSGAYQEIHVLVRRPLELNSPIIIEHKIDFDKLDQFKINPSIDHVFCTLGTTIKKAKTKENFRKVDYDYVLALGQKAKEWNAEKFLVVSSLGANAKSKIFYSRVKGEMEFALQKLNHPHLFIFRPSLLMGNRNENRAGEKSAIMVYKAINPLFIGKLKKYKGIEAKQVAKGMMGTALENSTTFQIFESDEIQKF